MSEHYTRNTVSVSAYCKKCNRMTQHQVSGRRKGPCTECIARYEAERQLQPAKQLVPKQKGLWEELAG